MKPLYKPCLLLILDGFGIAPPSQYNAISQAKTPSYEKLLNTYPTVLLDAAGLSVGLPFGEVGNSEVGHYNIGAGQLLYQSLPRINISIADGSFNKLPALIKASKRVKEQGRLHIIGMIGTGGVHSHQQHLSAILRFCKLQSIDPNKIFLHLILDGRDTAPDAGKNFLKQTIESATEIARIATISGRFYAMDRNNNWDRTKKAFDAITKGLSEKITTDPIKAIEDSYANKVFDEEFLPTVIVDIENNPLTTITEQDTIIFFNFRADRARQLCECFTQKEFTFFDRGESFENLAIITFTEYKKNMPVTILFKPQIVDTPLAKIFSDNNLTQYHIAETEKYAHVTFFFNGLIEQPFPGETRELIPSPAVLSYDEKPEMSAYEVTDKLIEAIKSNKYDFLLANYANADMVGHTGNTAATIKAIEAIDTCLEKVIPEVLKQNGICFITADHGNAEEIFNFQTYEIDKEHSIYPVPFIAISNDRENKTILKPKNKKDLSGLEPMGVLADVAPTILDIIGVPRGKNMKGGLSI